MSIYNYSHLTFDNDANVYDEDGIFKTGAEKTRHQNVE